MLFRRLMESFAPRGPAPRTGGRLVYAVGDIHGRAELLDKLLKIIRADATGQAHQTKPLLVFLGDYVDRGPESAKVVERILRLRAGRAFEVRPLKGNHELALLQFLEDPGMGPIWARHGGAATLLSYGVEPGPAAPDPEAWTKVQAAFRKALRQRHLGFYRELELMITVGDYAFVHAGVRPDRPLAKQSEHDLVSIRREFLRSRRRLEKVIVHGHTPVEEPDLSDVRLNIDTGAYATGVLTAVRLTDSGRKILQTR